MKILFLLGWHSVPGGVKPTFLKDHGHTVINPALDDDDFEESVRIAEAEFKQHHPEVIVGSSRGGVVAMNIDKRLLGSEELPFDDATFDCVVSTFTLCSIQQVDRALAEVFRVLKPEGRFLVLEHGLSNEPKIQKRQRRWNGLQRLLGDNCQLVRNIEELVRQQPFRSVELDEFYLEKTPKTHGYIYRGLAIR